MSGELEILPITVEQTVKILLSTLNSDELSFIKNSTYDELVEFGMVDDLHIDDITGLSQGNRALLEECSEIACDGTAFLTIISPAEAIEIIVKDLIYSIK